MSTATTTDVFDRVVCGVDASDAGAVAARLAALVTVPDGELTLVSANDSSVAVHAGWGMSQVLAELGEEARTALERGRSEAEPLHPIDARLVEGDPLHCLLAEIERRRATLAVVGSHGASRAAGIALGAVSTYVLHEAPCSVLIARGAVDALHRPSRIVVGLDGSSGSARAHAAATALAERLRGEVRTISAGEPDVDPVDVLKQASETADLIVVGSRGLKGVRALGSVSERIAHEAHCSVLVVRGDG